MKFRIKRKRSFHGRYRRDRKKWNRRNRWYFLKNVATAIAQPVACQESWSIHRSLIRSLTDFANECEATDGAVPHVLIFVFGFKGPEEFEFYMYLAVKSALHHNPGWKGIFIYCYEPKGKWWSRLKSDHLPVTFIQMRDFNWYGVARIHHYAHKADIVRLTALKIVGGAYLDIDTITMRSFSDLENHPFVMGVQAEAEDAGGGLCNAVMFSARNSSFVRRWLENYCSFNSKGRDKYWDFHSVKLPAILSYDYPEEVMIVGYDRFFWPLWHDIERILFRENSDRLLPQLSNAYVFHLWNSLAADLLAQIDEEFIANSRTANASLAREVYS
jgi:hypothetical protein